MRSRFAKSGFAEPGSAGAKRASWRRPAVRALVVQGAVLLGVAGICVYFGAMLLDNLAQRSIRTGFAFLAQPAGFDIGESLVPFKSGDSYGRALVVGLLNTLNVAAVAIAASLTL